MVAERRHLVASGDLRDADPFVWEVIQLENARQARKLIFIASESLAPGAVRAPLASVLGHIYAEGYPAPRMNVLGEEELEELSDPFVQFRRYADRRYYKGTDYMNVVEALAKRRASLLFANGRVSADDIHANVQPLSGAAANNAVYQAFLEPGDRILGMSLVSGGHLTHGSPVNRSGKTYEVHHYTVGASGRLDYDAILEQAKEVRPKIIVAGYSAYPWDIDWEALRRAADAAGALLMADISHTAGLVAAGVVTSPVGLADIVTFTTHKTLCGPRGATILTTDKALAKRIDLGVFPGEQGGPHMHQIAAKAVAFKLARTEEFRNLMAEVAKNAAAMAESFRRRGMTLAYGGTNTHLFLLDLKKVKTASGKRLTGEIASRVLDLCGITCNKNTIAGDTSALHPSGLRFGTTWVTQRGLGPEELDEVADIVVQVLTNLHSYEYVYAGGPVGRAKLPWDLLQEARRRVDAIASRAGHPEEVAEEIERYPHYVPELAPAAERSWPAGLKEAEAGRRGRTEVAVSFGDSQAEAKALEEGAALVDLGDCLLVEVSGRRAGLFLHEALTQHVLGLEEGQGAEGFVLSERGEVLSGCGVWLLERDPGQGRTWRDRYLLRLGPGGDPATALQWLCDLSDGYVYQDEDIYLKAQGPAVLSVLEDAAGSPLAGARLVGPQAASVSSRAGLPTGELERIEDGYLLRLGDDRFDIFLPPEALARTWIRLTGAGATPCGRRAYEKAHPAPDPLSALGDLVRLEKPFFVGKKALVAGLNDRKSELRLEPVGREAWQSALEVEELPVRRSCLYEEHRKLTKHLVPFAGWEMPVWYESIASEHRAVRRAAGLFDVSHMGVLAVRGRHAERFLDLVTSNYVPWLNAGQCHYSYLLDPAGGVIDDIIVYREARDRFMVVVNAVNAEKDEAWLRALAEGKAPLDPELPAAALDGPVEILNLKLDESLGPERRVDIAFQGQAALPTLLSLLADEGQKRRLRELERFHMMVCRIGDMEFWVARTGYTGESIGYELFPHPSEAPRLWNLLLDAGRPYGVVPTGLGARDSTRTEAGLPLWGHELAGPHDINPLEAGYAPFVRFHKPYFVGRRATLEAYHNWKRTVIRFQTTQPGGKPIRPPAPVVHAKRGECVGTVTSCVSVDKYQIGLAIVDRKKVRVGDRLFVYPAPHGKPGGRAPGELQPGDRTTVPIEALVLPRFMKPGETRKGVVS